MFLKGKKRTKELKLECAFFFWARLASFCHLGFVSYPLIASKFFNETYDPKGQENEIYTIVKGRETFYRRHTVPITSCSEDKYVLERLSFGSKECTEELNFEYEGMKTAGVTNYIKQTPPKHFGWIKYLSSTDLKENIYQIYTK